MANDEFGRLLDRVESAFSNLEQFGFHRLLEDYSEPGGEPQSEDVRRALRYFQARLVWRGSHVHDGACFEVDPPNVPAGAFIAAALMLWLNQIELPGGNAAYAEYFAEIEERRQRKFRWRGRRLVAANDARNPERPPESEPV
jgi:hypothetical protein